MFTHQNTDDETSGYLSDRLSPLMFTNQFHQTPCGKSLKDYSNYIYPSSSDETAPNKESMKMEDCRKMSKHQIPSVLDIDDVGHETDFSMPKYAQINSHDLVIGILFQSYCLPLIIERRCRYAQTCEAMHHA